MLGLWHIGRDEVLRVESGFAAALPRNCYADQPGTVPSNCRSLRMSENQSVAGASVFAFAVIMERRSGSDRWATERWEAKGVVPDAPAADKAPRTIYSDERSEQILFPGLALRLEPREAEGYYVNITSTQPKVFVMWRMDGEIARPVYITASYLEGVGWVDSGENVDSVALPEELLPHLAQLVTEHYRPEPKREPRYASSKDKGVASRR